MNEIHQSIFRFQANNRKISPFFLEQKNMSIAYLLYTEHFMADEMQKIFI